MPKSPSRKTLEARLDRLEFAQRSVDEVEQSRRVEWAVYQVILTAAGIDPTTLEWDGQRYCADDVRVRLIDPLRCIWHYLSAEMSSITWLRRAEESPITALGKALRQLFGLRHSVVGSHKYQRYAVDTQALELRRNLLAQRRAHATQTEQ